MRHDRGQSGRRREVVALVSVAVAVAIVSLAIPILAARSAEGDGAGIVPPLPMLLALALLAVSVALLALYRVAVERARRVGGDRAVELASERGDEEPGPAVLATPTPSSPAATRPVATSSSPSENAHDSARSPDELNRAVRTQVERAVASARSARTGSRDSPQSPPPRAPRPRRVVESRSGLAPAKGLRRGGTAVEAPAELPAAVEVNPVMDASVDGDAVVETCEIVWWHGARKGGFEARIDGEGRRPQVAARSRTITWSEQTPPSPDGHAADALRLLVERLEREGWRRAGSADAWYGARFERPLPVSAPSGG